MRRLSASDAHLGHLVFQIYILGVYCGRVSAYASFDPRPVLLHLLLNTALLRLVQLVNFCSVVLAGLHLARIVLNFRRLHRPLVSLEFRHLLIPDLPCLDKHVTRQQVFVVATPLRPSVVNVAPKTSKVHSYFFPISGRRLLRPNI